MERHNGLCCTDAVNVRNNSLCDVLVVWEGYVVKVYHKILSAPLFMDSVYCDTYTFVQLGFRKEGHRGSIRPANFGLVRAKSLVHKRVLPAVLLKPLYRLPDPWLSRFFFNIYR